MAAATVSTLGPAAPAPAAAAGVSDTAHTFADAVHSVHRAEHAARIWLPYGERVSAAEQMYAAVSAVTAEVEAKVAAAAAAKRAAAAKADAKFAAAAAAQTHAASHDAYGGNTGADHSYAPPVSASELQRFRLELLLGAVVGPEDVPRSGDKLSSSFFTGSWRRATLRWGPASTPAAMAAANAVVPEVHVIWPKTQAQVAAAVHANHFPPITNPSGMWLLRDPAVASGADGVDSHRFYVADGAYRATYLLDPNNKPPYAIAWPVWVIENDPKFAFWVHQWNPKSSKTAKIDPAASDAAAATAAPVVPPVAATPAVAPAAAPAVAPPAVTPAATPAVAPAAAAPPPEFASAAAGAAGPR